MRCFVDHYSVHFCSIIILGQSNFQIFKIHCFNGAIKSILWLPHTTQSAMCSLVYAVPSPSHDALPAPASLPFPPAAELSSPHPTPLPAADPISVLAPFSVFFSLSSPPLPCHWHIFFLKPYKNKVSGCLCRICIPR